MNVLKVNTTTSVGFLVGISAWSISFITLIWAYLFYRLRTNAWLDGTITQSTFNLALLNTLFLILSSLVFHQYHQNKTKYLFVLGNLFGISFIAGQLKLWSAFLAQGISLKSSVAGSFFYLLTGFHALHIIVGIIILVAVSLRQFLNGYSSTFDVRFYLALKFWDLLLLFWAVLLVLIFILK